LLVSRQEEFGKQAYSYTRRPFHPARIFAIGIRGARNIEMSPGELFDELPKPVELRRDDMSYWWAV
jgi:hypothetical protein